MDVIQDLQDQLATYYDKMIILLPKLAIGLIVSLLVYLVLRVVKRRLIRFLRAKAQDKLLVNFLESVFSIVNFLIVLFLFLYTVGQSGLAGNLLGAATLSSVVIGFAFKDIAENFLAGVIMAFNRPFRVGDSVMTGSVEGSIVEMSLRDTHIKTFDGKDVYVPNGQIIKNPLYNYTIDGFIRGSFVVGVDYNTDIEAARKQILQAVRNVPGVLVDTKPPRTHVKSLGVNTVDIEVHYWIDTFDRQYSGLEVKSVAQTQVLEALTASKVGMPANIVELKAYGNTDPVTLTPIVPKK